MPRTIADRTICISGNGIAAACCVRLLSGVENFRLSFMPAETKLGPTLLVNPSTRKLLSDVFSSADDLFDGLPQVHKRIVLWGNASSPTVLPHAGIVVNESALLAKLWEKVDKPWSSHFENPDWSIYSTPKTATGTQRRFGTREASTVPVELKEANADACWVESLDTGWLFLISGAERTGFLLAIGGSPDELLEESRLIAQQICGATGPIVEFAAAPRILNPLCAPGWLACGSGAMGFDPICGEGVGHAVREAILATAVIRAIENDEGRSEEVLAHYSARLGVGFLRHLNICRQFYAAGPSSEWWRLQLADLDAGIEWTRSQLSRRPPPALQLVGFDLKQSS